MAMSMQIHYCVGVCPPYRVRSEGGYLREVAARQVAGFVEEFGLCRSYIVSLQTEYRCVGFARLKRRCGAFEVSWCRCCLQPCVVAPPCSSSHLLFSRIVYCFLFLC
jgi:hypothetical protein